MKLFFPDNLEDYVRRHSCPPSALLTRLEEETKERKPDAQMLTGPVEGTFLKMLVKLMGATRAVDIGTYTGYSALMIAEGLPPEGEVITCETDEDNASFAMRYFNESPHGAKVRLRLGPALQTLADIPEGSTDFVFIDADKTSYLKYYEESLRILRPGGLMAVDNVLWSGEVLNPEEADARAIADFNERVSRDDRVECVMLSVRDGVFLIRKL